MIEIQRYTVKYEIIKPIIFDTWPGFYLRNALVKALTANCHNPNRKKDNRITNCHGCKYQPACAYFALNLPVDEPLAKPLPMPFILDVDNVITGKYEEGTFSFQITLFGTSKKHVSIFCKAFSDVGAKFGIGEKGKAGNVRLISMGETADSGNNCQMLGLPHGKDQVSVGFKQLKLAENQMKYPFELSFSKLLTLIASRLNELEKLYGENPDNIRNSSYQEKISEFRPGTVDLISEMSKCNQKYPGNGKGHYFLNGKVTCTGNVKRWLSLLKAGSRIGIGRFTSYGFGKFEVRV